MVNQRLLLSLLVDIFVLFLPLSNSRFKLYLELTVHYPIFNITNSMISTKIFQMLSKLFLVESHLQPLDGWLGDV
jgi:hypothetical protein